MTDIRLYKLDTGEEVIGRFVEQDDEFVTMAKVRTMAIQPTGPGQMGITMIPWMVAIPESDIKIRATSIVGVPAESLPKQLEDGYMQNTSGLQIASAGPMGT